MGWNNDRLPIYLFMMPDMPRRAVGRLDTLILSRYCSLAFGMHAFSFCDAKTDLGEVMSGWGQTGAMDLKYEIGILTWLPAG